MITYIKESRRVAVAALFTISCSLFTANAQIGEPYIHDPSTLAECDGKYYTFGTGGGGLISSSLPTAGAGTVAPTVPVAVLPPTS